jgi:hypothetical protein
MLSLNQTCCVLFLEVYGYLHLMASILVCDLFGQKVGDAKLRTVASCMNATVSHSAAEPRILSSEEPEYPISSFDSSLTIRRHNADMAECLDVGTTNADFGFGDSARLCDPGAVLLWFVALLALQMG